MFPSARASALNSNSVYQKKEAGYTTRTFRMIFKIPHFSFQILCPGNTDLDCCKSQLATQLFCQFICKRMLRNLIQHSDLFFSNLCVDDGKIKGLTVLCHMLLETEKCVDVEKSVLYATFYS